jgi:large conductance mechanosensitive channel
MSFMSEFKEFAVKGNAVDMAVGIVIGVAFGNIVNSLVKDIIMPPIGLLTGGVDFTNLFIVLNGKSYSSLEAAQAAGAPTVNYGVFINTIINFIIIALAIFLVIRRVNAMKKKPEEKVPDTKNCPYCKETISKDAVRCPHCTSDLKS